VAPSVVRQAVLQHLGTLHTYETVLVLVVAFGPFLVIAALVLRERVGPWRWGAVAVMLAGMMLIRV